MTGEIPRVSSDPEDSAATNVTPNIVRHVDASDSGAEATGPVDPGLPPAPAEEPVAEVDIDPGDATSDGAAPVAAEPGPPAVPDDEESVIQERSVPAPTPSWHADYDDAERDAKKAKQKAAAAADGRMPARRSRGRNAVLAALALAVVLVLAAGGYVGARHFGLLTSKKDFTDQAGTSDVLVTIPENSSLTNFGEILKREGVVGSVQAFINAAGTQSLSGGIYQMRTGIPAATAVQMMEGTLHRVGRVVIPEGVQLEAKRGVDRKTIPGVFDLVADATSVTLNGKTVGVTAQQLEDAAKSTPIEQLGIPTWAREGVAALPGDYRRIEGLIAPGTWEAIDPEASPTEILKQLISDSTSRYESWGLLTGNRSGLKPYEVLIAASIMEREVRHTEDLPKVGRVILNRLAKNQRLEMDSTTNYTAAETNIDVHGDNYKADTRWNTYRIFGLPPTPIATVGENALKAMLDPPKGNWLYFLTVDKDGQTVFSDNFEEHKRNRNIACQNKFLKTGC
ncbi:endolytic transglycosylase MltG [Gordonia sp. X0973]|nr:endolytic transglycosylase MltG [Gordonia sp. X0973]